MPLKHNLSSWYKLKYCWKKLHVTSDLDSLIQSMPKRAIPAYGYCQNVLNQICYSTTKDNPFNSNNAPNFVPFAVSKVRFTSLILTKSTPKRQIKKKKWKWNEKEEEKTRILKISTNIFYRTVNEMLIINLRRPN